MTTSTSKIICKHYSLLAKKKKRPYFTRIPPKSLWVSHGLRLPRTLEFQIHIEKKRFVAIDDGRWISRIPYPTNPEGQTLQWGKLQDWTTENGASLQHCAGEHLKSSRRGWKFRLMIWRKKRQTIHECGLVWNLWKLWVFFGGYEMNCSCWDHLKKCVLDLLPTHARTSHQEHMLKGWQIPKKPLQCYLVGGRWKVCEIGFSLSEALEKEWKGLGKFVRNLSSLPTKLASMTPVDPYTSNTRCFNMSTSVTRICAMFVRDKTTVRVETRWYPVGKVRHHEASQCENWFVCVCKYGCYILLYTYVILCITCKSCRYIYIIHTWYIHMYIYQKRSIYIANRDREREK